MKKEKLGLALFSAAVLLMILLLSVRAIPETGYMDPVVIQAGTETVTVWTADGENYYGFLPGHARSEEILLLPQQDAVMLDGRQLPFACDTLESQQIYDLTWQEDGQVQSGTLCLMESSGVATLYIDTQSGSMDYIHEEKGNAEYGRIRLYDEAGTLNYSGDLKAIRGRGNSTWVVHDKKPYSLDLMNEADLLGMGAAKDWILLADALDSSAMRNKIVYDFAARAGLSYTPECRWTEVYLNGNYAGLYLLAEKVEVDDQRVDLGPDGSLICMDRDIRIEEEPEPYFVTDGGQYLQVQQSADLGALQRKMQAMEDALVSSEDWQAHIDLDSWVKKYMIEEIFGSYDAGFQSQYFYCYDTASSGKIYAGPIWDFDSSLGNPAVWALNSPRGLFAWRPEAMNGYGTPWFHSLYEKNEFHQLLKEEYSIVFLPLLEELLTETIGEYEKVLCRPFERNRIRWDVETEGVQAEAMYITEYLQERTEFLTRLWLEDQEFCIVRLRESQTGGYYAYYAVEPGEVFTDLPRRTDEDFLGWYREDTETLFDPAEPITGDLQLYPRYVREVGEETSGESLYDRLLAVYHYVPAAVLLLMGILVLPVAMWKSPAEKRKQRSRVE